MSGVKSVGVSVPKNGLGGPRIAVQIRGVSKSFGTGERRVAALREVDWEVHAGQLSLIVGPSGCGKTTLLSVIAGILDADEGSVTIFGQEVSAMSDRARTRFRARHIGFVFQNFSLAPVLSAYENVEYPLLLIGVPAATRRERTLAMLEAVGLENQSRQRPNELSGGQKQRVAIARALVKEPTLVLADEPTANLDSETGAAIIDLMHRVQTKFHTTFVFSTHDPHLMSHADETFTIRDGRLVDHQAEAAS
jgi:putative ABC transport system ATP-binding protein